MQAIVRLRIIGTEVVDNIRSGIYTCAVGRLCRKTINVEKLDDYGNWYKHVDSDLILHKSWILLDIEKDNKIQKTTDDVLEAYNTIKVSNTSISSDLLELMKNAALYVIENKIKL